MERYKKVYNRGNEYFDTYHIMNVETGKCVGILEDHARGVKTRYYVGWHFEGFYSAYANQCGKTETFDTEERAMQYITDNLTK